MYRRNFPKTVNTEAFFPNFLPILYNFKTQCQHRYPPIAKAIKVKQPTVTSFELPPSTSLSHEVPWRKRNSKKSTEKVFYSLEL